MTSIVGLTELLNVTVTPAPGAVQDTNLTEVAGNAVDTGVGASGAGTQRVALSSDSVVTINESSTPITASGTANGTLFTADTLGYQTISVQLTGNWQALCTFQASNDNVNFVNVQGYTFNNFLNSVDTAQDNDIYIFPVTGRYFRVVVSSYSSGPVVATAYLRTQSLAGIGESMLTQAMDPINGTPIQTTFNGIQGPGQQPAANSMPVALANEQVLDKHIIGPAFANRTVAGNTSVLMDPSDPKSMLNGFIDCLQYRSIYLIIFASAAPGGSANFEGSNDGVNWVTTSLFNTAGYGNVGITSTTGFSFTAGLVTYSGPLMFRYFRMRLTGGTTSTTSTLQVSAVLRMAPYTYVTGTSTNILQVGSSGLVGAATMTNAQTASATTIPLTIGGPDRSLIRQELLGAPYPILNNYVNGPYMRNAYFDLSGSIGVAGPQPFLAEDKTYPVNVRLERSTNGQDSVQDLLQQILGELKAMNYYIRELPLAISTLNQSPNPNAVGPPGSMADDPENFFDDRTTYRYVKGN